MADIFGGVAGLVATTASQVLGKTMGSYSSYGFSLNQGIVNSFYSAAVNNGIPLAYKVLFGGGASSFLADSVGFTEDATPLDIRHLVSVFSTAQNRRVRCPIQDQIEMRVGSDWQTIVPEGLVGALRKIDPVFQGVFGVTTYQKFFTRRIWAGSTPLTFKLPLKFVAVKDAYTDVVLPVQSLFKMALPRVAGKYLLPAEIRSGVDTLTGGRFKPGPLTVLSPPGPSVTPEILGFNVNSEQINIYFGRIAWFYNVIVKDVSAIFDSRVDSAGKPISAKVDLTFETYEMCTAEDVEQAFACVELASAPTTAQ